MKKHIIITLFFLGMIIVSMAQTKTPRADARQKAQRVRIADGRKDGDLTNREAAALNKQQRHIRRTERRTEADGTVTPREKAKLERKQDRANRKIRRAKHNDINKND